MMTTRAKWIHRGTVVVQLGVALRCFWNDDVGAGLLLLLAGVLVQLAHVAEILTDRRDPPI